MGVTIKLEGIGDVDQVFKQLADEIGDKKATSKVLIPAVREAMKPVLAMARANAPVDTGDLRRTLQIEARRPSNRDRRSKYVQVGDKAIAVVTTAPGKKLKKMGVKSDARAVAQEFGTSRNPAHPFLRTSLESQAQGVVDRLAHILARRLETYRKTT